MNMTALRRFAHVRPLLMLAGAVVLLAVAFAVPAGTVLAHAVLLRSDPAQNARLSAGPARVDLIFSEALNHAFSRVEVRESSGTRVDKGDVRFTADPTEMTVGLGQLPAGFYTVAWTTVSAVDGHRLQGTYPFVVLNPNGSLPAGAPAVIATTSGGGPHVLDVLLRWLLLVGLIGVAGGFAFSLFVLLPVAGAMHTPDRARAFALSTRLLRLTVGAAGALALLATPLGLVRQIGQAGALGQLGAFLSGRTGELGVLRELVLAGALACALCATRRRTFPDPAVPGRLLLWCGLLLGIGGLVTLSFTSHAAARAGAGWSVPADLVHLTGVAFWLGSLAQLPALLGLRSELARGPRYAFIARAVARFSTLVWVSVAAVVLTGLFNASVEVASLGNFGGTQYGDVLISKLNIVAPLLALGAVNALVLAPRIDRAAMAAVGEPERAGRMLAVSTGAEAVLGLAVLAATATLVFAVPSRDLAAQKRGAIQPSAGTSSVYHNTAPAGDLRVSLTVSPNRAGENEFKVQLSGPDADQAQRVELRFQATGQPLGGSTVDMAPVPGQPDIYDVQAANLSFVGRWQVTVNVRRASHDDVNGAFTVEVPDVTGATTISSPTAGQGLWSFPGSGITANQWLGVVFVFAGVLVYRLRRPLRALGRAQGFAASSAMLLAFIAGFGLFFATHSHGTGTAQVLENPVPADQRSIDDGYALYMANCAQCHGQSGHGDGPDAAALTPKPLDLTVHAGLHPQYQLYDWITNGIPGTSMPAWKSQLTDQQRWDLVNELETLRAP